MQRVFEFGERVGLALSLVLWIAWVVGGAAAAWHSGKFVAWALVGIDECTLWSHLGWIASPAKIIDGNLPVCKKKDVGSFLT